jgi:hypothetical protein
MPGFLLTNNPTPPMPENASERAMKVLGSDSSKKHYKGNFPTSKEMYGECQRESRRNRRKDAKFPDILASRSRVRPPARRSPIKVTRPTTPKQSENAEDAPTPPEKDTPERVTRWLKQGRLQDSNRVEAGTGLMMHRPIMKALDSTTTYATHVSPKKYCPGAEDYAQLAHAENVKSAYGVVEHTDTDLSGMHTEEGESSLLEDSSLMENSSELEALLETVSDDPDNYRAFLGRHLSDSAFPSSPFSESMYSDGQLDPLQTPRPAQRRHSEIVPRTPLSARVTRPVHVDTLETLKPTVYVPPAKVNPVDNSVETQETLKPTVYVPSVKVKPVVGNGDGFGKVSAQSLLPQRAAQAASLQQRPWVPTPNPTHPPPSPANTLLTS